MCGKIVFVGNALLDITSDCDNAFLAKYGLKQNNAVEATSKHDDLFKELMHNSNAMYTPGGSAQNSARFTQWALSSLDHKRQTVFIGCIGDDNCGKLLYKAVQHSGVHVLYDVIKSTPTGVSACLVVDTQNRSMVARLGAASRFNPSFLTNPEVWQHIEEAMILYVEGYFFTHNLLCIVELAKHAEKYSKIFAVNLSAEYIAEENFGILNTCLNLANIVFGNVDEVKFFTKQCKMECSTTHECALALSTFGSKHRIAIITQASDPVVLAHMNIVKEFDVPAADDILDTIGCGDAFVGGVLAAMSLKKPIEDAIKCGIYCASKNLKTRGCSIPEKPFSLDL